MTYRDTERAKEKEETIQNDLVEELSELDVDLGEEELEEFADKIVEDSVQVKGPEEDTSIKLMVSTKTGGKSTKPGNIRYHPTKILEIAASGSLTVGSAVGMPVLAPAAAIVLWASVWRGFSIDITTEEAFVYWIIWKHQDEDGWTPAATLPEFIDEEVDEVNLEIALDESDIEQAVSKFLRIDALQKREHDGDIYYHPREYCKTAWE
ncbi:uncharacterized protein HHUB_4186 (plasmid) [Halobacterium hubeiense]|uniref:Uncharacterized protein n=1 Tax=Halobacterium hubeiense TaxID=1407499 RepID=A0A0U5H4Q4_9EURY|nr:hypothetical protein [Halobacterium hubeiense]CQH63787.1 uncharacterized protein HHUB_4186 [Halobacterium hubeiense]